MNIFICGKTMRMELLLTFPYFSSDILDKKSIQLYETEGLTTSLLKESDKFFTKIKIHLKYFRKNLFDKFFLLNRCLTSNESIGDFTTEISFFVEKGFVFTIVTPSEKKYHLVFHDRFLKIFHPQFIPKPKMIDIYAFTNTSIGSKKASLKVVIKEGTFLFYDGKVEKNLLEALKM
jgi:hypothetical protein